MCPALLCWQVSAADAVLHLHLHKQLLIAAKPGASISSAQGGAYLKPAYGGGWPGSA